ncbi:hypothetical protein ACFFX0_01460 [Citricoccus parietis]|uniref:Uncharacterized protein n=1 Tax=Citricoccus parietis TaxID=592307 RepID=A0ABV5FTB5_9MICC
MHEHEGVRAFALLALVLGGVHALTAGVRSHDQHVQGAVCGGLRGGDAGVHRLALIVEGRGDGAHIDSDGHEDDHQQCGNHDEGVADGMAPPPCPTA